MTASTTRLLSPEEIAVRAGNEPAFLRLPDPTVLFAERELRLRQLAAGHAMRDYLLFTAELSRAQQEAALQSKPPVPEAAVFERAAERIEPPLPASGWTRDASWRDDLRTVLRRLAPELPGTAKQVVTGLVGATDQRLDEQADRLLNGVMVGLDLATAPLIAAGLQVHFSCLVATSSQARADVRGGAFGRVSDATICPCCGSRPVASILRFGSEITGQRYLHCTLCQAEWHMVRIKCAHCESLQGISYQQVELAAREGEAAPAAVRAECCDRCGHYLKLVAMDKDPHVEPVADDLATVALDLLVSDSGLTRHGVNLLLLYGEGDSPG